jgi:hypothetical protein
VSFAGGDIGTDKADETVITAPAIGWVMGFHLISSAKQLLKPIAENGQCLRTGADADFFRPPQNHVKTGCGSHLTKIVGDIVVPDIFTVLWNNISNTYIK